MADRAQGQANARRELTRLAKNLNERDPVPDRSAHKAQLIEDLQKIYDDTVAANLERADGQQYFPTRLLVAINRAREGERDPIRLVTDTIRRQQSDWFNAAVGPLLVALPGVDFDDDRKELVFVGGAPA